MRGTPYPDNFSSSSPTVHPRGCGEHYIRRNRINSRSGSSPRVRGTHSGVVREEIQDRFIPAGAGNTLNAWTSLSSTSVHPRGCGEHFSPYKAGVCSGGSSPRVRGTQLQMCQGQSSDRFIPAGAGNTITGILEPASGPVHPRRCGEHSSSKDKNVAAAGSSPRVRGTRALSVVIFSPAWFIPAGAGNTPTPLAIYEYVPVHPRGCGEHFTSFHPMKSVYGSSPRVRGTR